MPVFRPFDYDNNQADNTTTNTVRGIVRRGRRYQLRLRLPAPLARQTGRRELRLSLGTGNLREALRRDLPLLGRLEQLFFDLGGRNQMTEQTVQALTRAYQKHLAEIAAWLRCRRCRVADSTISRYLAKLPEVGGLA